MNRCWKIAKIYNLSYLQSLKVNRMHITFTRSVCADIMQILFLSGGIEMHEACSVSQCLLKQTDKIKHRRMECIYKGNTCIINLAYRKDGVTIIRRKDHPREHGR